MGIFKKKDKIIDFLEKSVDNAKTKAIVNNAVMEIKFFDLALNIASTYIASAISTCEFKVHNDRKFVKDIIYYKLNFSPNPNDTATSLKYQLAAELAKKGQALLVKYKNYLYYAESFSISKYSPLGYEFDGITIQDVALSDKFNRNNSMYFSLSDENKEELLNKVNNGYKQVLSSAIKSYKKTINNKWKLNLDTANANDFEKEDRLKQEIEDSLKKFIEADEGLYVENNGYNLQHMNIHSDKDTSDIRNLRKDIFDMVAQAFKMPVSMLYGNVTNLKEVINQFITFSVKPYASVISEEMTRAFFSQEQILAGYKVEVDISTINYRDIFDVADKIDKLIYSGTADIDEARKLVNMPQLNTKWSNQHWMTKNNGKIEDVMNGISNSNNSDSSANNDSTMKGGDIDAEQ